jgi:hypothetical protein
MKSREYLIRTSKHCDFLAIVVKLAPGECPQRYTIEQRVEIGARSAAT